MRCERPSFGCCANAGLAVREKWLAVHGWRNRQTLDARHNKGSHPTIGPRLCSAAIGADSLSTVAGAFRATKTDLQRSEVVQRAQLAMQQVPDFVGNVRSIRTGDFSRRVASGRGLVDEVAGSTDGSAAPTGSRLPILPGAFTQHNDLASCSPT